MTSINDFATTYMCQSLPFGGIKHSGFDRFAGVEGLRGLCVPKVSSVRSKAIVFACPALDFFYLPQVQLVSAPLLG